VDNYGLSILFVVIPGLDPPARPKPLRRGEGPGVHAESQRAPQGGMDCRVKPGNDDNRK
jgi:peptide/nickel transport system ATP-binding protein